MAKAGNHGTQLIWFWHHLLPIWVVAGGWLLEGKIGSARWRSLLLLF